MSHEQTQYAVNLWGSHPDAGNDDWWTSADFRYESEARNALEDPDSHFHSGMMLDTTYIELVGPNGLRIVREIEDPVLSEIDDSDWMNEHAMQAGMAHGCAGYNAAMGY